MKLNLGIWIVFLMAACLPGSATGQDSTHVNNELSKFFADGIYLENLDVTVPWDLKLEDASKYGNPRVIKIKKKRFVLGWDSATIWDGTKMDLKFFSAMLEAGPKNVKLMNMIGSFSLRDGEKILQYFKKYAGAPNYVGSTGYFAFYYWRIEEGIKVRLYIHKHKDFGHLEIERRTQGSD